MDATGPCAPHSLPLLTPTFRCPLGVSWGLSGSVADRNRPHILLNCKMTSRIDRQLAQLLARKSNLLPNDSVNMVPPDFDYAAASSGVQSTFSCTYTTAAPFSCGEELS
mmetsp:Transcript_117797/g.205100  ORF Transcript_117797/g.205100 Transcript_117797/m.205100 type:complete len:109 (-) Transcript_117797:170-496(-)